MYNWELMPHLGPTAGIGLDVNGEPFPFVSEDEYRKWYYRRLNAWLRWA